VLPAVGVLAACAAAWEAWVRVRDTPDFLLPAPSAIGRTLVLDRAVLWEHTRTTLVEATVGLVVGAALGVVVAGVIAVSPLARRVLSPILVATQTIPMIILAPLLVLWFGFGLTPKVLVVALVTFFPVAVATAGGLTVVDTALVDLVRVAGASWWQELRHVRVPHAVPPLFDGLRIAAAYTVAAAVVGEWTGASAGLGVYIARSQASFRVDQVFVAVAVVAALSAALFVLLGVAARLAMPWRADDGDAR
jgi:ABC-type nitrate/sulfonate/bicarbonate transport system permease component